jgi:hypothetical protein
MRRNEARRRCREQLVEVGRRQQQVGRRAITAETVAQRIDENLRRSLFGRGVQRRQTERLPQVAAQVPVLVVAIEQRSYRAVVAQPIVRGLQAAHETHGPIFSARLAPRVASRPAARCQGAGRRGSRSRKGAGWPPGKAISSGRRRAADQGRCPTTCIRRSVSR